MFIPSAVTFMIEISYAEQQRRSPQRAALSIGEFCDRYAVGRTLANAEIKTGRLRARKCRQTRLIIAVADAEEWLQRLPEVSVKEATA